MGRHGIGTDAGHGNHPDRAVATAHPPESRIRTEARIGGLRNGAPLPYRKGREPAARRTAGEDACGDGPGVAAGADVDRCRDRRPLDSVRMSPAELAQALRAMQEWPLVQAIGGNAYAFPLLDAAHILFQAFVVGSIAALDLRLLGYALMQRPVTELVRRILPWTWAAWHWKN